MGKGLSYLKNWGLGVNYYWNYGSSKLLLHFIEYQLDQLKSKHRKKSSKLNNTIFWRPLLKELSTKSLKFFGPLTLPPTLKWWPCKTFAKLNVNNLLMANIFKLHEYQTFGLMKMHDMCTIWFANNIFSLLRWNKKYFFMVFQGLSITRNCLRSETAPLTTLDIERGLLCNFAKILRAAILQNIVNFHTDFKRIFSYYWILNLQNFLQ